MCAWSFNGNSFSRHSYYSSIDSDSTSLLPLAFAVGYMEARIIQDTAVRSRGYEEGKGDTLTDNIVRKPGLMICNYKLEI